MPNYIKNRIDIKGSQEQVKEIVEKFNTHHKAVVSQDYSGKLICHNGDNVGWLNTKNGIFSQRNEEDILGLPSGWHIGVQKAFDQFPDFNKVIPQPSNIFNGNLGRDEEEMCKKEGRPTWYDWNRENWGTKWNSLECASENDGFTFITAWCGVPKVIEGISKAFPDVEFKYEFADEDTGYNVGSATFKGGDVIEDKDFIEGSKEAYELAFKLRPESKDDYVLIDGNYQYREEDE